MTRCVTVPMLLLGLMGSAVAQCLELVITQKPQHGWPQAGVSKSGCSAISTDDRDIAGHTSTFAKVFCVRAATEKSNTSSAASSTLSYRACAVTSLLG